MKSVYFKNFIIASLVLFISFVVLGAALVFVGRTYVINEKRDSLELNAQSVEKSAEAFAQDGALNGWNLRMTLTSVSSSTGHHIFVCDAEGLVVSCSDMRLFCEHMGKTLNPLIVESLRQTGHYDQLTTLYGFYEDTHYVVARPIEIDGNVIGYVFACSHGDFVGDAWGAFVLIFAAMAVVIMGIAVALSYYSSKRQAKPIDDMAAAARKFAHGDFSVRVVGDDRQDEVGELTEAFNQMADSLERSEKLRSEFIANVSHELRTPMTTISGFADGLLDGTIPREAQDKYLGIISSETKRLSRLVRSMLELSRLQRVDPAELKSKSFDVNELITQILLGFEGRINEKGLTVELRLPEEPVEARGDRDGINQVVYNLLDNAVKFSAPTGELTVMLWKQDGKAMVSVKNIGETIPPEDLGQIFARFHKSDRSRSLDRSGVGLGLYIVKTILGNHDEDIFVTSSDGVTEFVFTLTLK